MPVEATLTYEQTVPRRPAEEDIINGPKTNATATVPPHMPAAEEYMQLARLAAAGHRMLPMVRLHLRFNGGGVPFVHAFACVRGDLELSDFTVTDVGTGITRVEWPAGTLPTDGTGAKATVNATTGPFSVVADVIVDGVEVRTWNGAGSLVNVNVTVEVF